jgi:hypothetical protein
MSLSESALLLHVVVSDLNLFFDCSLLFCEAEDAAAVPFVLVVLERLVLVHSFGTCSRWSI